jgi:hypothetical protein
VTATARRLWEAGDPLAYLLVWTAAVGASIAWVALVPGRPDYRYDGQLEAATAGAVLLLFFLYRRSENARRLGIFAATFGVLAGVFGALTPGGATIEGKFVGLAVLQGIALAALLSPPLGHYVHVRRRGRPGRVDEP